MDGAVIDGVNFICVFSGSVLSYLVLFAGSVTGEHAPNAFITLP